MSNFSRSAPLFVLASCVILTSARAFAAEPSAESKEPAGVRIIQSRMIWDAAPHNAFTDLTRWKERWYCSFREGAAHSSYDGAARILSSDDGQTWRSVARLADEGLDLRDPKLCVLPDGRLLLGVGVRRQMNKAPDRWESASRVYITQDGEHWEGPHTVGDPNVWMWRHVSHRGWVYSFGYAKRPSKTDGGETFLRLYRSRDGVNWETIAQTEAGGGYVNETAFVLSRMITAWRCCGARGAPAGLAWPSRHMPNGHGSTWTSDSTAPLCCACRAAACLRAAAPRLSARNRR